MAGEEGLEPSHAGIKIRCLDQLGDSPTREDLKFSDPPLFVAGHPIRLRMYVQITANPQLPT